jgi:hypothetical protein
MRNSVWRRQKWLGEREAIPRIGLFALRLNALCPVRHFSSNCPTKKNSPANGASSTIIQQMSGSRVACSFLPSLPRPRKWFPGSPPHSLRSGVFLTVSAESLRVWPPHSFVVTWRPAARKAGAAGLRSAPSTRLSADGRAILVYSPTTC